MTRRVKRITMAKFLRNGSLQILMIRDAGGDDWNMVEMFLDGMEQRDRRFMAMRIRQKRSVLMMPRQQGKKARVQGELFA